METKIKEAIEFLRDNGYYVTKIPENYVKLQKNVLKLGMVFVWSAVVLYV